jgi:hypothetical protein
MVVDNVPSESGEPSTPYPLTPQQYQFLAAANASIANVLDHEGEEKEGKQGAHVKLKNHGSAREAPCLPWLVLPPWVT